MSDAKKGLVREFAKRGRTVTGVHDVSVRDDGGALGTMVAFTGGTLSADRFEIVTATGPLGDECIVVPFDGHSVLPGEYHLTLHGALRSPVEYLRRRGGTWHAGQDEELAGWLKSQKYSTYLLPDELHQGTTKVKLESILQLFPIGPQHSALVFTLGGNHTQIGLEPYLNVAGELAGAIGASAAPGPLAPLGEIRHGALAAAALAGELDVTPEPAGSAPAESVPTDAVGALRSALTPLLDKRVLVAPIDDKTLGNIVKKVAKDVPGDAVIGFLDTGVRASGKSGWAFTVDTLHISSVGTAWSIPYAAIRSFGRKKSNVEIDSQVTGAVTCDVFNVEDAAIAALEAVTGLGAND